MRLPTLRMGLRTKLIVASLALILLSFLSAYAWLSRSLERLLTDRVREDLVVRLMMVEHLASETALELDDLAGWDRLADQWGRLAEARVSVIRRDGQLIGDSDVELGALTDAENHAERPEVIEALLSHKTGRDVRVSATLHSRMLYVARPFGSGGEDLGVTRLALSLTEVDHALSSLRWLLLGAMLIALGVAVVLSSAAAHLAARYARNLAMATRRMAAGDLSTRIEVRGTDEFAQLGQAMDQLAQSLSSTLSALRSERDLLNSVLNGMHDGVLMLDEDQRVALVNPALREMLLLGHDAAHQPLDLARDPVLQDLLARARSRVGFASGEIELEGLKPRRLLVRAQALSGEPGGLLVVFVDVTDLRRLEKLRRDFVANVSHELRTPVTAVRSAAETLRDAARSDPSAVPRFVDIIDRNAERLHRLVEDLLDLSRLDSREYKLALERVELSNAVQQVFALFRERAEKKGVQLVNAIPETAPAGWADRRALEQVLTNLLENAIKYCPPGAVVRVQHSDESAQSVRVMITDTGVGIEAKHLPRLFERFYRIDKGRSRDIGGTGLGLSIVKHLVEAMGGTVGVTSEPGRGSTFSFSLKRSDDTANAA